MKRPRIVCHMVTSIDGAVTGDFLGAPECSAATEVYYEINREYKKAGSGGFICGRVTMEESFTGGFYPDLSGYPATERQGGKYEDFLCGGSDGYFAIAFDPRGRLGWRSAVIEDSDPGYGGARIVEVLTEQADGRYLSYLRSLGIPYLIAGEDKIDVPLALSKLASMLSPELYLLEGGSVVNGYFLAADCVDELSLVTAPVIAGVGSDGAKPVFYGAQISSFELLESCVRSGALTVKYAKK